MQIKKFTNSILSSNSYVIFKEEERHAWLVDPGDSQPIFNWLTENNKAVKGILLTHYHIDHIYGVNDILEEDQSIDIYASEQSLDGLYSSKMNGSLYMEMPYEVTSKEIQIVDANTEIELFASDIKAKVLSTPGHDNDCISFEVGDYLFTGDALIPGVKIHTKSKNGDKLIAQETIKRIFNQYNSSTIICPGHKEMTPLGEIQITEIFTNTNFIKVQ